MLQKYIPSKLDYYKDLILILTQKEIKVKYKSNILGYFWSVAHPLAFALTYFFVFKVVMRFNIPHYALFLIAGLFPWQAFSNSLMVSTSVFVNNASLIKKLKFPRYFLIFSVLLNDIFHFVMSLPVLLFFLCLYGLIQWGIFLWLLYIPLNLFSQFLITFGLALIIGSMNVFFRDMERLVQIFLNLWFYFTPILYTLKMVPPRFSFYMQGNPLTLIMLNWQKIFLEFSFDWVRWMLSLGIGGFLLFLGILVYSRLNPKFSEVI